MVSSSCAGVRLMMGVQQGCSPRAICPNVLGTQHKDSHGPRNGVEGHSRPMKLYLWSINHLVQAVAVRCLCFRRLGYFDWQKTHLEPPNHWELKGKAREGLPLAVHTWLVCVAKQILPGLTRFFLICYKDQWVFKEIQKNVFCIHGFSSSKNPSNGAS